MAAPPWPLVVECHGHEPPRRGGEPELCQQCDGSHDHRWVEATHPEQWAVRRSVLAVRCSICGARKCAVLDCWERSQHVGPHISIVDGSVRQVGR